MIPSIKQSSNQEKTTKDLFPTTDIKVQTLSSLTHLSYIIVAASLAGIDPPTASERRRRRRRKDRTKKREENHQNNKS